MKSNLGMLVCALGWTSALLGVGGVFQWGWASEPLTSQIVAYLEVAEPSGENVTISLGDIALVGETIVAPLDPSRTTLDAASLLGGQVKWVEQRVPAGHYAHLSVGIESVQGTIGPASVKPEVPTEPILVPLDIVLAPDQSALLVLRWVPRRVDPDVTTYLPRFQLKRPQTPPLGSIAFVSNEGSGYLSVIDRFTGRIVGVLAAGIGPRGLTYSRVNQWVYVADAGGSQVVAIDVLSMRGVKQSPLPFGSEPSRLVVDDVQNALYVLSYGTEMLSILDPRSLEEIDRVMVGRGPRGLTLDPVSGRVYVSLDLDGLIQVYDPVERRLIAPLSVGTAPGEITFSPDTGFLYVADGSQRRVTAFHPVTGELSRGLTLCSPAQGLVFNPVSRMLYVAQAGCRAIAILQPERGLDVGSIDLPEEPGLIAMDQDFRHLLVPLPRSNQLVVYNVNSRRLEASLEVGAGPYAVVVP